MRTGRERNFAADSNRNQWPRVAVERPKQTHQRPRMNETEAEREGRLRELASKLFFTLKRNGSRYDLYRDADVSRPVQHEGLTLDEVEEILNRWKLRGPHGG